MQAESCFFLFRDTFFTNNRSPPSLKGIFRFINSRSYWTFRIAILFVLLIFYGHFQMELTLPLPVMLPTTPFRENIPVDLQIKHR